MVKFPLRRLGRRPGVVGIGGIYHDLACSGKLVSFNSFAFGRALWLSMALLSAPPFGIQWLCFRSRPSAFNPFFFGLTVSVQWFCVRSRPDAKLVGIWWSLRVAQRAVKKRGSRSKTGTREAKLHARPRALWSVRVVQWFCCRSLFGVPWFWFGCRPLAFNGSAFGPVIRRSIVSFWARPLVFNWFAFGPTL